MAAEVPKRNPMKTLEHFDYTYIKLLQHTQRTRETEKERARGRERSVYDSATLSASVENYLMTFLNLKRNMRVSCGKYHDDEAKYLLTQL